MNNIKIKIKKYFNVLCAMLLVSIAFNLFLSPNNLAAGGVSGLAIVFNKICGINISLFILIANIILIILSYIILGKEQTKRTILGSIILPILIELTSDITKIIDISETELIVKAVFGGILSGIGFGIVFKHGFTTGGTDIVDQIASKYLKITMSTAIIVVDGLVVLSGGIVFGIEKMIYAAIALILMSVYSNKSMVGMNDYKTFYISTNKIKEIREFLTTKFNYNITLLDAVGGYTKEKKEMIMCVIRTHDYYEIEQALKIIDPNIFVSITNSYEAINHGKKQ